MKNWIMGSWSLRSPMTCCLQVGAQESTWYSSSLNLEAWDSGELMVKALGQVQSPENQKRWWPEFQSKYKRKPMSQLKQSGKSIIVLSYLTFLFYSGVRLVGWSPPSLKGTIRFPQGTNSNVNLFQTLFQTHPEWCWTKCPGTPWPSQVDT